LYGEAMLTDATLDAARLRGDALADATVTAIFDDGRTDAVATLLSALMRDDQSPGALPPIVLEYLDRTAATIARSEESIAAGEQLFAVHGPEIMVLLCCYSLPSSYAARKGVQVLHRTAYLAKRPNRRLFETAQFIVDVMSPGGLGPKGRGLRTAQKVRLMHAAIRHLIQADAAAPWDTAALGVPINQEDLLGTLMTFSWIILDGLARLGIRLTPLEQQAYLDTWLVVGGLMGIEPELLPGSVEEARALTALIERRQVAESPEGREMMAALLAMMQTNVPRAFRSVPACMIREFLPSGVAQLLGVPSHHFEEELIALAQRGLAPLERFADMEMQRHALVRAFSLRLMGWMINVETDGRPAKFTLPESLQQAWHLAPEDSEESLWEKMAHHFKRA
jgi:hypothetical protein